MRRKVSVCLTRPFRWFASRRGVATLVGAVLFGAALAAVPVGAQDASDAPLDLSVLDDSAPTAPPNVAPVETPSAESPSTSAPTDSASAPAEQAAPTSARTSFVKLVLAGGWIGAILLAASFLAVSLAIRLCLALRRSVFAPPALEAALADRLARGELRGAFQAASESDSFVGRVAAAGLREADRGWNAVEKALEDAVSDETAAFYRKTEPLATIGNVAPMLGLLGTVVGMVATFGELASADAGGRNLANGIYFALVTTVDGLLVAIPVLVAHSLLNGRVATLVSENVAKLDRLFAPVKRGANANETARFAAPKPAPLSTSAAASTGVPVAPPTRRPTATPGLEEIAPSRGARPALSLKPKQGD